MGVMQLVLDYVLELLKVNHLMGQCHQVKMDLVIMVQEVYLVVNLAVVDVIRVVKENVVKEQIAVLVQQLALIFVEM